MSAPVTFPLLVRCRRDGNCAVLRPEPPRPGSQAYTRIERVATRLPDDVDHVIFDMSCYGSFDSQNLAVIVALLLRLNERGLRQFSMINVPRQGWSMLVALGLDRYFAAATSAA